MGFNVYAMRIVPISLGIVFIYFFYSFIKKNFNTTIATASVLTLTLHPFFYNAAHLYRQEILVLSLLSIGLYLLVQIQERASFFKFYVAGFVLALPVLTHPYGIIVILAGIGYFGLIMWKISYRQLYMSNSYLISPVISRYRFIIKNMSINWFVGFFFGIITITAPFIYFFFINIDFYVSFANSQDMLEKYSPSMRIVHLIEVYFGNSDMSYGKIGFIILNILIILLCVLSLFRIVKRNPGSGYLSNILVNLLFFIGLILCFLLVYRVSRFYMVYLLVGFVLFFIPLLYYTFKKWVFYGIIGLFCLFSIVRDYQWFSYFQGADYHSYSQGIKKSIPDGATVLGKINYRLSFEQNKYYAAEDFLSFIKDGYPFAEYLNRYSIDYIILDYAWYHQGMKGNADHGFYGKEFEIFLNKNAILVHQFYDSFYSNRFGVDGKEHVGLPYGNLLDICTNHSVKDKKYWTKIYKILK